MVTTTQLQSAGYLRLKQIIGDKQNQDSVALIPVSKSTWWAGVKNGRFPAPVKLTERTTAWKAEDILNLIEQIRQKGDKHVWC